MDNINRFVEWINNTKNLTLFPNSEVLTNIKNGINDSYESQTFYEDEIEQMPFSMITLALPSQSNINTTCVGVNNTDNNLFICSIYDTDTTVLLEIRIMYINGDNTEIWAFYPPIEENNNEFEFFSYKKIWYNGDYAKADNYQKIFEDKILKSYDENPSDNTTNFDVEEDLGSDWI